MRKVSVFSNVTLTILLCFVFAAVVQAKDINLGWSGQGGWTTLPYVVAKERGFFEKEGLKVQLITFRGTNLMLTALLTGDLDYATIFAVFNRRGGAWTAGEDTRRGDQEQFLFYGRTARDENVKALRGKKIGINSFGSSADYAAYAAVSRSGIDPNKDLTILAIGGGAPERLAAVVSGSVDATVITSPGRICRREAGVARDHVSAELGHRCAFRSPVSARPKRKWKRTRMKSSACLRALRLSTLYLLQNQEYSHALFQRIMHVDAAAADRLFKLYRDQYNPELSLPDSVMDDLLAVGTFRLKEKPKNALGSQAVRDWSFAERAKR